VAIGARVLYLYTKRLIALICARGSNVEIGAKVSENMVDEISKFKKEVKFIYEEMNRPYYKSNAKNDPCGARS